MNAPRLYVSTLASCKASLSRLSTRLMEDDDMFLQLLQLLVCALCVEVGFLARTLIA